MAYRPPHREPTARSTHSRGGVAVLIAVAILTAATLGAQSVSTGVQEYYVLGWEQHIWDMMDRVQNGQGGAQFADGMNSVVTATASADNQVIYYDHWEDGPDGELVNFPNVNPALLQTSTVVIGDGLLGNGDICDYNGNITCPSADVISAGDYVNFNSDRGLGGCTTPATPERCSVPLNPRVVTDIRFDGGDLMKTSGGPLTVIHSQYPLTNFIGGSIEILSRQAVEAARSYSVPIGEDLYVANTVTEPFHYVDLDLVAFEDTAITVESPGAGSVSFALARGEHWSSQGFINDVSQPTLALTINSGTKVSTSAPISGLIFTGGDGTWATRLYTLLPDILHSTDYVTTAPGDDPTAGPTTNGTPQDRPANVYILNPDQLTTINVQITDITGTSTVTIPPNSMRSMDDLVPGRDIAANSTVRMTSDRTFWGVTAYDWDTNISDWGHSWLAKKFLTNFYTVGFGPGNQNQPPNGSQYANAVFVSATADRTRVQFDLDNDGTWDLVDLDGNGTADAAPYPDSTYEVDMLSALRVIDPGDNDMTGARILANKPVAVSWGQDTDRSYYSDQALDTGFTVYPVNQLFLDPALTIDKEVDTTVVPTDSVDPLDRTVTYTLTVKSYGFGPLTDVEVWDLLPTTVYGDADYVPNSTLITCPDLMQGTADPSFDDCTAGGPPADQDCGRLTWNIDAACGAGFTLGTNNTLKVSYQVVIPPAPGGLPRQLTNEGHAQAVLGGSIFSPFDTARVVQTDVTLGKAVDVTAPAAGDVITFTLQVANTSTNVDETDVFISDPIPADTTFVSGSITADGVFTGSGVFDASQNAVVWNAALFPWGASATLSFQVRVNPTVPAGTEIPNRGGYESAETPYFLSNEVEPVVQGPLLQAVKTIVGNPTVAHPSEIVTFQIHLDNNGTAAASNVFLSDPFPGNAAYVAGSMSWSLNSGPFAALSDANDGLEASGADGRAFADRLEFRLASLGASQDVTLRFRVLIDPGTAGQFLANQAVFSSDETSSTDTNLVQVPIVGDSQVTGHVFLDADGDGVQDPGEPDIANVDVVVTDPTGAVHRVATDANGDYTASVLLLTSPLGCYLDNVGAVAYNGSDGSLGWAATPWTEYGSGADGNPNTDPMRVTGDPQGAPGNNTLLIQGVGGNGATRGFTRAADLDPGSSATLTFRYFRLDFEADDQITLELNYGSGFGAVPGGVFGQPSPGVENDSVWQNASFSLDTAQLPADPVTMRLRSTGGFAFANDQFFFDDVEICAASVSDADVTLNVDETDPDFPPGAVLTTANDPQTVAAVQGGTVASGDVGYRQPDLIFTKTSNAINNEVSPGQTVTYTMTITNNTGATQTAITLGDPLPTGTSYVAGSSRVSLPPQQVSVRVSQSSDDAEENLGNGGVSLANNDLDMVFSNNTEQAVGVRFQGMAIPPGATVASAVLEFLADETDATVTNLVIAGQAADNPGTFTTTAGNISSRPRTAASVTWTAIPAWTQGVTYQTANLAAIVQEIVDRPGWASGNSMVMIVSAGAGCSSSACQRVAEVYDSIQAGAPLLNVVHQITASAGSPPSLLSGGEGYTLPAGGTMTVTFQVVVDDPLAGGITQIVNTATLSTASLGPYVASVTDNVVRAGVVIEYDNAGFGFAGDTVSYAHVVENTGEGDDSYDITLAQRLGWAATLVDPGSGAVIAADANGDGVWDGGVEVNTGTLAPGGTIEYELRVTIPGGTAAGVAESSALRATSDRNPGRFDVATDETMVVDVLEPVTVLPDNSGVASSGGTAIYTHRVLNNTGAPATFLLTASRETEDPPVPVWPTAFYWDANSDGVYTPGVDIQITNTSQLAQGEWQTVFVVVSVPGGVADFTTDVVHIKAALQTDPDVFGTATDTTTVRPPLIMDLSGGGTRWVDAGDSPEFPGVLRNFTGADDRMTLSITESWFFGVDSLAHPVELVIDTTGNGAPDTSIATDSDGDGTWDSIAPGYDTVIPDGEPDVLVAAGGSLSYTLLRAVDLLQGPSRDPVTLTALSDNTGEQDSVTATLLLAAATDATLASFDAFAVGGKVVVEWRTAVEIGTLGFDLWRQRAGEGGYTRVNRRLVRGLLGPLQGGTYRVLDGGARPGETVNYILAETDTRGRGRNFGPFTVTPLEDLDSAKTAAIPADGATRTVNTSRVRGDRRAAAKAKTAKLGVPSGLVKVAVREPGLVWLANNDLAAAFGVSHDTVTQWIADGALWINEESPAPPPPGDLIFADGFESGDELGWREELPEIPSDRLGVAWVAGEGGSGIYFYGEALDSPYTEDNVYWLGAGHGAPMARRSAVPSDPPTNESFAEMLHFEEEWWPLTSVMTDPEGDFWMWDYFFSNTPGYDVKTFVLPVPDPAADGGAGTLRVYLQGASVDAIEPNHNLEVRLNGSQLGGTWSWHGDEPYVVEVDFPQSLLVDGDNVLEIAALAAPGLEYDVVYLDAVEVGYLRLYQALGDRLEGTAVAGTVAVTGFSSDDVTVYDITDPVMPVVLYSVNVEPGENGFAVSFEALEGMRFLVATPASAMLPVRVEADLTSNLSDPANAGRYVVVAGPGLEGEAAAFAALREAQGLSAVVAPVEDVYDEFSGGIVTPWAIRDFLRHATENWTEAPEYVFLLGDGSLDHTNRDGLGESLVPAPFTVTGDGLVPSDNSLADWLGDDGVPELAIGRLPAQSAAEAAAYRQKVAAFEASDGDWKRRTLWLADEPDIGGDFGDDTDGIISAMPGGYAVERIYLDDLDLAEAWELTLEKMAAGALLVNFLGHGGLDRIADEGLLLTDDVELMENGERAPFLTALTCIVGRFDIPDFDTFAEALLLKGDGGAVAVWSPAAFSMNESAKRLGAHHIQAIAGGSHSTFGSTVRAALAAYAAGGEGEADLVRIVTLLGDPATRIEWQAP